MILHEKAPNDLRWVDHDTVTPPVNDDAVEAAIAALVRHNATDIAPMLNLAVTR